MTGLTYDEMVEASTAFVEASNHVLSNYSPEDKTEIAGWITSMAVRKKPYLIVTPEGTKDIREEIFTDKKRTDYVLSAWFTFAARWANSDDMVAALANNLARGCTQSSRASHGTLDMPVEYKSRFRHLDDVKTLLASNPWLIVVLMLLLSVSTGSLPRPTSE